KIHVRPAGACSSASDGPGELRIRLQVDACKEGYQPQPDNSGGQRIVLDKQIHDREDQEDHPDTGHQPTTAIPEFLVIVQAACFLAGAVALSRALAHWRALAFRVAITANTTKIIPHATRLVAGIHSGSGAISTP